ncbi:MAG: tetratricopeptide repeat protein [bacterium]|nr:tetratricopeptide repeat protein [bacterium]
MLPIFSILFAASLLTMAFLLLRKTAEARSVLVVRNTLTSQVPLSATARVVVVHAGNITVRIGEKILRRVKIALLKFDNISTRWLQRMREKSQQYAIRYSEWRMQKYGAPKISFDYSFVTDFENRFEGFFRRYFRRGVGYDRAALRDDLELREKVLVGSILQDPKDVEAYRALGLYYFEQNNYADALAAFEAIRKIDPTNSDAATRVAHIKESMNGDK